MIKYTIEVDSLYELNILAPIAEMLSSSIESEEFSMDDELKDALSCLFSELMTGKLRFDTTTDYPEKWQLIAKLADDLSKKVIRSLNT